MRTAEAQRAAALLGAKLEFGNLRDAHITEGVETIEIIEAAIRELRPTHVYTHCLEDTHQDHRAVHAASLVAARDVPNVYCYQSPSSTVEFRPNRFVDITEYMKAKLQAIGAYQSQVDRMAVSSGRRHRGNGAVLGSLCWSCAGRADEDRSSARQRDEARHSQRIEVRQTPRAIARDVGVQGQSGHDADGRHFSVLPNADMGSPLAPPAR